MSKIGRLLLEKGLISDTQLRQATTLSERRDLPLDEALIQQKALLAEDLLAFFTKHLQFPLVDPLEPEIPNKLLAILTPEQAARWRAIPVGASVEKGQKFVHVALADPTDEKVCEGLREILGPRFKACAASADDIRQALSVHYADDLDEEPVAAAVSSSSEEVRALTRLVKAMRDLLIEKEVLSAGEIERQLKRQ